MNLNFSDFLTAPCVALGNKNVVCPRVEGGAIFSLDRALSADVVEHTYLSEPISIVDMPTNNTNSASG